MVDSINARYGREFSDMVHVAAQQTKFRLQPYVKIKTLNLADFAYDGIEDVEAHEVVGRNAPTIFSDITHTRRKLKPRRFAIALPIDVKDLEAGALVDPQKDYAQACVNAIMRLKDRLVVQAAFADVRTGPDFENTVTFAQDGGITVNATAGLTYEKLLEIEQNFVDNEVGNDNDMRMALLISGREHTQLMGESELVSGDYTRQFAVEKGKLTTAMGFDLIKFGANAKRPVLPVASTVRSNVALAEGAMVLGIAKDITIRVTERPDLNYTTQVYADVIMDALRTEGKLVQKVTTTI